MLKISKIIKNRAVDSLSNCRNWWWLVVVWFFSEVFVKKSNYMKSPICPSTHPPTHTSTHRWGVSIYQIFKQNQIISIRSRFTPLKIFKFLRYGWKGGWMGEWHRLLQDLLDFYWSDMLPTDQPIHFPPISGRLSIDYKSSKLNYLIKIVHDWLHF